MKKLLAFVTMALLFVTAMVPEGLAESLTDTVTVIEDTVEVIEAPADQPVVIVEETADMPVETEAVAENSQAGSEAEVSPAEAPETPESEPEALFVDEIVVDASDIALSGDEPIVIDEMIDEAALVGVMGKAATVPTLDISHFDEEYLIVEHAEAYPKLFARVAWRFLDKRGEGMLIVSTSFVDPDNGEVEIVKPQVSGTFDYCQIIITDTRRPSTKRPAQVNRIISQTIKANAPTVETVTLSQSSATLKVGETLGLTVTVTPAVATVTWSSSDPSVATVSNGQVTAVKAGTATITATANDGSGKKATCAVTVTQPTVKPEKPANVKVSADGAHINISWTKSAGATYYEITYGAMSSATIKVGDVSSYTLTGLRLNTAYNIQVSAWNSVGGSGETDSVSAKTLSASKLKPTITSVTASGDSATVAWNGVSGVDGFKVTYSTSAYSWGSSGQTVTIDDGSATQTVISGLTYGSTYYFRVTAVAGDYESSQSDSKSLKIPDPRPAAPTQSTPTASGNTITVSWNSVSNATGYTVFYGTADSISKATSVDVGNVTSYSITGLQSKTKYYTWVKAINNYGISSESSRKSITTGSVPDPDKLPAPTGVRAMNATKDGINISWNAVSGASGYNVYYSTSSTFSANHSKIKVTGGNASEVGVTGLSSGTKYYLWVAAYDSSNTIGSQSSSVNMTTGKVTLTLRQNSASGATISNSQIIDWPVGQNFNVYWSNSNGNGKYLTKSFVMSAQPDFNDSDINKLVTGVAYNGTGFYYGTRTTQDEWSGSSQTTLPFNFSGLKAGQYVKIWIAAEDTKYSENKCKDGIQFALRMTNLVISPALAPWRVTNNYDDLTEYAVDIIAKNESSKSYTSVRALDGDAPSIGIFQWNANRALNLLRRIAYKNPTKAYETLGDTLYRNIEDSSTSWTDKGSLSSAEVRAISALLGTPEGIEAQNEQAMNDATEYLQTGRRYGLTDPEALLQFADVSNLGTGFAQSIATSAKNTAGSYAKVTLDIINNAAHKHATIGDSKGYSSRHQQTYSAIKALNLNSEVITVPAQPTNVTAVAAGTSSIRVTWTKSASANVSGYRVYYDTTTTCPANAYTSTDSGSTSATITGLSAGTGYYVWVSAYNSAGESARNTSVRDYDTTDHEPDPDKLPAPTGVRAMNATKDGINIAWNTVSGASGYYVYYSTSATFSVNHSKIKVAGRSSSEVGVTGLSSGTKYYLWVAAYDSSNTIGSQSSSVNMTTGKVTLTLRQNSASGATISNGQIIDWPVGQDFNVYWSNSNGNGKYLTKSFVMSAQPGFNDSDINKLVTGVAYNGTGFYYGTRTTQDEWSGSSLKALPFSFNGLKAGQYVKIWIAAEDTKYSENECKDGIQFALRMTNSPSSLYIKQSTSTTCTLASAVMMMRAKAYYGGSSSWSSITESSTRSIAWLEGVGLYNSFNYTWSGNKISVNAVTSENRITSTILKSYLDSHPEGIVLYVFDKPHAIYLTDYVGETFYCADPAGSYSGRRIPVGESYMCIYYGWSQSDLISHADKIWYISSSTIIQ